MSNPFPLMSKGEEKKKGASIRKIEEELATEGRVLKRKQKKYIAINAKGGDYWKCCH